MILKYSDFLAIYGHLTTKDVKMVVSANSTIIIWSLKNKKDSCFSENITIFAQINRLKTNQT